MRDSSFPTVEEDEKQQERLGVQERLVDTLSSLPNDIIAVILSSIPTEIAVDRMSLLAQNCRDLWTLATAIDLDQIPTRSWLSKQEPCSDHINGFPTWQRMRRRFRKENIAATLERYMQFHEGCFTKFKLKFIPDEAFDPLVDRWLRFAVERRVKEFDLDLREPKWDEPVHQYRLPTGIFSSPSSLQVLTLRGCIIDQRSFSLQNLYNLKKVVLDDVQGLSTDMVEMLLLHSESLTLKKLCVKGGAITSHGRMVFVNEKMKNLKIIECSESEIWLGGCEIDAPNLENLKFVGRKVNFRLRSAPPKLNKATVSVNEELGVDNGLRRLLNQACSVTYLTLGFSRNYTRTHPAAGGEEAEIPLKQFLCLRDLLVITGGTDAHRRTVGCVIENAPRLRKFDALPSFMVATEKRERRWERFLLSEFVSND